MRLHPMFGALLLASACGGGTLYSTLTATPSSGPADVVACARAKLKQLGYQQTSFDETENRLTVRKIDNSINRPDPQYRRNVERIEIETAAAADGRTSLKVVGHTIAEYETHRGPTEVEERASANVNQATQAVIESCGQS
jgi:hypothetical protein